MRRLALPGLSIHTRMTSPVRRRREASARPASTSLTNTFPRSSAAATRLREGGWWTVTAAITLTQWALDAAEGNPAHAERGLTLATAIGATFAEPPLLAGHIAYAQARRAVHSGDLDAAESALLAAQAKWQQADATMPYARTFLGLTQVLTMQGRFEEAEAAAQRLAVWLVSTGYAAAARQVRLHPVRGGAATGWRPALS